MSQKDVKTTQKWCQNDANWPQSDPKTSQKWSKITHFWPIFGPFWPYFGPFRPVFGFKTAQKRPEIGEKGRENHSKSSRPSSKCIKTFKIHSGYFQIHPLAAHFHILKCRFWPLFKQNKCFIAEKKNTCFGQICKFLVNFRRSAHIFATSCMSLVNICSQLRRTSPGKSQNDRKNGPKKRPKKRAQKDLKIRIKTTASQF